MKSYSVRCIFRWSTRADQKLKYLYEERITLWHARSLSQAIKKAEKEARKYIKGSDDEYIGLAQAYELFTPIDANGVEVFSLLRESNLKPKEYLDKLFDTGHERAT